MNFCSVPYEADYGMYADSKMKSVPQYPISMGASQGQGQPLAMQPLNPPQMNLQMQMPMSQSSAASYPMQGMPLSMMQGGNQMTPMSTMSTQLPIGAVTPLNSMTMMPMMGNPMGAIDAPGINAVLPDLQPMSSMGQMQPLQSLQQYNPTGSTTQMNQGRLAGGCSTGMAAPCPSSPTNPGNWSSSPSSNQMMTNANMWQYSQPMQSHQPQYQQLQHFQQQNQSQQQVSRMKPSYDAPMYRDMRNGLNTPSMHESSKYSKGNQSFNCGKAITKVPHWR